jgi:hypothetical protein
MSQIARPGICLIRTRSADDHAAQERMVSRHMLEVPRTKAAGAEDSKLAALQTLRARAVGVGVATEILGEAMTTSRTARSMTADDFEQIDRHRRPSMAGWCRRTCSVSWWELIALIGAWVFIALFADRELYRPQLNSKPIGSLIVRIVRMDTSTDEIECQIVVVPTKELITMRGSSLRVKVGDVIHLDITKGKTKIGGDEMSVKRITWLTAGEAPILDLQKDQ